VRRACRAGEEGRGSRRQADEGERVMPTWVIFVLVLAALLLAGFAWLIKASFDDASEEARRRS
jgi:type VI protein secretion system component VasF